MSSNLQLASKDIKKQIKYFKKKILLEMDNPKVSNNSFITKY